jgi:hypothetical protein
VCCDMCSPGALKLMAQSDIIFCNNLLFDHTSASPESSTNQRLGRQLNQVL